MTSRKCPGVIQESMPGLFWESMGAIIRYNPRSKVYVKIYTFNHYPTIPTQSELGARMDDCNLMLMLILMLLAGMSGGHTRM